MFREENFVTGFSQQCSAALGLQPVIVRTPEELAPSDYPALIVQLGKTTFPDQDAGGVYYQGKQEVFVAICFKNPHLKLEQMLNMRSAYITSMENFVNLGYVPPPMLPGELYRICSLELLEIAPPDYTRTATTFTLTFKLRYHFMFV